MGIPHGHMDMDMDMEMHGAREFEVIKLNEERVPVRVFAHMLVHYINHGCSHLQFPAPPLHVQGQPRPPRYAVELEPPRL